MSNQPKLTVRVMTPREIVFQGEAIAVSSKNIQGKFDILAGHANFISLIEKQPIIVLKLDKTKQSFVFNQAIIHLKENLLTIFGDIYN